MAKPKSVIDSADALMPCLEDDAQSRALACPINNVKIARSCGTDAKPVSYFVAELELVFVVCVGTSGFVVYRVSVPLFP